MISAPSTRKFLRDTHGFETVEYAIILGFIVASSLAILVAIGLWVGNIFTTAQADLNA